MVKQLRDGQRPDFSLRGALFACLHKHTYSTFRKNVSSTSEPTYTCLFRRVHVCFVFRRVHACLHCMRDAIVQHAQRCYTLACIHRMPCCKSTDENSLTTPPIPRPFFPSLLSNLLRLQCVRLIRARGGFPLSSCAIYQATRHATRPPSSLRLPRQGLATSKTSRLLSLCQGEPLSIICHWGFNILMSGWAAPYFSPGSGRVINSASRCQAYGCKRVMEL